MIYRESLSIRTQGRGTYELTSEVSVLIQRSQVSTGLCHLFCRHTSASLTITENADPAVRRDLERAMGRLAPDGAGYEHDAEGSDDMPAHIRAVLTGPDLVIPVADGRPDLGTWQGVFLWEHRLQPHRREILVTVIGE